MFKRDGWSYVSNSVVNTPETQEEEIVGDVAFLQDMQFAAATQMGPQYDNLGSRIATN